MEIPDLVGIRFEEVSKNIECLGETFNFSIKETLSPFMKKEYKKNECRVVRQQNYDNTIVITVSYF
ncbi:hypothetical protein [Paramaledivibacter caminithermalis]|jgi:hypothetical protein|uniref:Uncharacterized protein n=1 Tax=Paramaledivibacter caminithermalis (strain DSM 15212 / CIP 107654 / DViRD3) TaxID=1121301 RepID=A0A1M6N5X7_PARC5|nr:hypothetical protein [Paramaledivibacter caminithermalis]SHJ91119.1 hypothetical protein SAMN02745912_01584 [Paramaledivibacter caminithermalis DSM 15212]